MFGGFPFPFLLAEQNIWFDRMPQVRQNLVSLPRSGTRRDTIVKFHVGIPAGANLCFTSTVSNRFLFSKETLTYQTTSAYVSQFFGMGGICFSDSMLHILIAIHSEKAEANQQRFPSKNFPSRMGRFPSSRELQMTLYESLLACFHWPMSQLGGLP